MKAQDITVGMEIAYSTYGHPESRWHFRWLKRGIVVAPASHGQVAIRALDEKTGALKKQHDDPTVDAPAFSIRTRSVYSSWADYTTEMDAQQARLVEKQRRDREYEEWFEKNRDEVRRLLNALGIDVIVTDHHLPEGELPAAVAVLNPNRLDCNYPAKNLCGAAVAWKLAGGLLTTLEWPPQRQQKLLSYLR